MASLKTKFSVGLFMVLGVMLAIALVIWLGVSNYLDKGLLYAAYFDESVQGLDQDSAVKYRGVTIGKVQEITVAPDGELIQVVLKIDNQPSLQRSPEKIVAQLKSVGITGLMYIELNISKSGALDLTPNLSFQSDFPVIATRPSDISLLFQSIDNVLTTMGAVDLNKIFQKMADTLDGIDAAIRQAHVGNISTQLNATLTSLNHRLESDQWQTIMDSATQAADRINHFGDNANSAVARFDRTIMGLEQLIEKNRPTIDHAVKELDRSIATLNRVINGSDHLVQNTDQRIDGLNQELLRILQRLDAASQAIHQFSEQIAQDPTQLLWGKPPSQKSTLQQ
jgi:phospholipid/cholesterol/gamma-HCH transport system substrate-binding protein